MGEIKVNQSINNIKETIISHIHENNFYEVLIYLALYFSIGGIGLVIKYIQEKFSGNRVIF